MHFLSKSEQETAFLKTDTHILKFMLNSMGPRIPDKFCTKENKIGGITLCNIIDYYVSTVIKTL